MNEPVFLSLDQVLILHRKALERFGGSDGIREQGLLESAVFQPQNDHFYGGVDLYGIASAYAFHLAENQPFVDGNKRTAVASALIFMALNGLTTDFDSMPLHQAMLDVAQGKLDKEGLATMLRTLAERGSGRQSSREDREGIP